MWKFEMFEYVPVIFVSLYPSGILYFEDPSFMLATALAGQGLDCVTQHPASTAWHSGWTRWKLINWQWYLGISWFENFGTIIVNGWNSIILFLLRLRWHSVMSFFQSVQAWGVLLIISMAAVHYTASLTVMPPGILLGRVSGNPTHPSWTMMWTVPI